MIDMHCHLLPGIDDGARGPEEALDFCRLAAEDGVSTIVCTPHMREGDFRNPAATVRSAVAELREAVEREGIPVDLRPGSEVHLAPDLPARIASGELMTYNDGGRYLLLELPYRQYPVRLEDLVFGLTVAGIVPVLAHPERIRFFQDDVSRLEAVIRMGCLGQMTSSSLTGTFGGRVRALSEELVERRLVHVLGSDAHDLSYRPPRLAAARARWAELSGEEEARRATGETPQAILDGAAVEPPEPRPPRTAAARGGLLGRLLGRR